MPPMNYIKIQNIILTKVQYYIPSAVSCYLKFGTLWFMHVKKLLVQFLFQFTHTFKKLSATYLSTMLHSIYILYGLQKKNFRNNYENKLGSK